MSLMTPFDWYKEIQLPQTKESADKHLNVLRMELDKLTEAHTNLDMIEAIGQIMFTLKGLQHISNGLAMEDFDKLQNEGVIYACMAVVNDFQTNHDLEARMLVEEITRSKYSMLCETSDDMILTTSMYNDDGIPNEYTKSASRKYHIVRNRETGKLLKSVNYSSPDLTDLEKQLR